MEKKSRILYIKRFLEEQTDEEHPAAIADIIAYLAAEGIPAARKSVARDIELIIESGADVSCIKGRQNQYFIYERCLERPELKLLLDAVQASKFLTEFRSGILIEKLLSLVSVHQAETFRRGLHHDLNRVKPQNDSAYLAANLLFTAQIKGLRVRFKYYEYGPDKKKTFKHGRKEYEFSPWGFIWNGDSYYAIGYSESHGKAVTFRIDRIATPELTDISAVSAPDDLEMATYAQSVFQMYDGPLTEVSLDCDNDMMKVIIDRFGEDVQTEITDQEHFRATTVVAASKMFFGWVFGMDGTITISAPSETVKTYKNMLSRLL
jgi:predicted DNA-binding transcriptional regulator YafY